MIVLDTHIWNWWTGGEHDKLSRTLLDPLADAPHIGVAAISCFEWAFAHRRNRLKVQLRLYEWLVDVLEWDGLLASDDGQFVGCPEPAPRLLR